MTVGMNLGEAGAVNAQSVIVGGSLWLEACGVLILDSAARTLNVSN